MSNWHNPKILSGCNVLYYERLRSFLLWICGIAVDRVSPLIAHGGEFGIGVGAVTDLVHSEKFLLTFDFARMLLHMSVSRYGALQLLKMV